MVPPRRVTRNSTFSGARAWWIAVPRGRLKSVPAARGDWTARPAGRESGNRLRREKGGKGGNETWKKTCETKAAVERNLRSEQALAERRGVGARSEERR